MPTLSLRDKGGAILPNSIPHHFPEPLCGQFCNQWANPRTDFWGVSQQPESSEGRGRQQMMHGEVLTYLPRAFQKVRLRIA